MMTKRRILLVPFGVVATCLVTTATAWACTNLMGNLTATGDLAAPTAAPPLGTNLSGFSGTCGSVTTTGLDDGTTFAEKQTVATSDRACASITGGTIKLHTAPATTTGYKLPATGATFGAFSYGAADAIYYGQGIDPLGHPSTLNTVGHYNVIFTQKDPYPTHTNYAHDCVAGDGTLVLGTVDIDSGGLITAAAGVGPGAGDGVLSGQVPTQLRPPAAYDNRPTGVNVPGSFNNFNSGTNDATFNLPPSLKTVGADGKDHESAICVTEPFQFYAAMAPVTMM